MAKRGGKRKGAGNKASDGATVENTDQISARVFKEGDRRAKFKLLGGSAWLRAQIDNAELRGAGPASPARRPA